MPSARLLLSADVRDNRNSGLSSYTVRELPDGTMRREFHGWIKRHAPKRNIKILPAEEVRKWLWEAAASGCYIRLKMTTCEPR